MARREDDTILPRLDPASSLDTWCAAPSPERHEIAVPAKPSHCGHLLLVNASFDADFALWEPVLPKHHPQSERHRPFVTGGVRGHLAAQRSLVVRAASGGEPVRQLANRQPLVREYTSNRRRRVPHLHRRGDPAARLQPVMA